MIAMMNKRMAVSRACFSDSVLVRIRRQLSGLQAACSADGRERAIIGAAAAIFREISCYGTA
jgi:hypothetical protein